MSERIKQNKILIGIIALAIIARLTVSTSPAIAVIGKAFPQASATQVESVATIGDVAAVISALIFGKLLAHWTFKRLAIISVSILALGGLTPLFWHNNIENLLLAGFIAGLGAGGITTLLPSLQSYAYQGEQLANMLGRVVALENGSSMILLFLGGILASQSWLHNYYLFALTLISLPIVILTLPAQHPGQSDDFTTVTDNNSGKHTFLIIIYLLIASSMVFLEAVLYNKNALYIQHFNLGNPTLAGKIMTLDSGAAIIVGLTIKWFRQFFKQYLLAVCFALTCLGGTLMLVWPSIISIAVATFLIGTASATMLSTIPYILSSLTTPQHFPLVMGCFSAFTSLGFSSSAFIFNHLVPLFNPNLLQGTYQLQIIIAAVLALILFLGSHFFNYKKL